MKSRHPVATPVLTVDEAANYLHVSRSTIYRLLKRNQLPALRIGNTCALMWKKLTVGVPTGKKGHPAIEIRNTRAD